MTLFVPLWADVEWVKVVAGIVMFTIWALNRMMAKESPAAKQAKARQQARPNPPQPAAQKQRVEDEVGEFLRRAAQQKTGKENRPAATNQPSKPPKLPRGPMTETAADRRGDARPAPQESA